MAIRDTTPLPVTNPFKVADNAGEALIVLSGIHHNMGNVASSVGNEDLTEADKEAILTIMRNRWAIVLVQLDAWRALPGV